MYPRLSFAVLLLGVTVFTVSAHFKKKLCDCGLKKAKAIDGCGCEKFVVRPPKPIKFHPHAPKMVCHKLPGPMKFEPIDDICTCDKTYVKPALLSKPFCSLCDKDSKHYYHSPPNIFYPPPDNCVHKPAHDLQVVFPHESAAHSVHTGAILDAHVTDHVGSYHHAKTLVADPVSLSIAYRNAQKRQIKEDAIAFGPIAIPKDGTIIKPALNIPEDGLLSFDKQVVELKAFGKHGHATVEEEAHEALRLAQEKNHLLELDVEVGHPARLSYADVGYLPEKHKPGPQFVVAHGGLDAGHVDSDVVLSASVSAHPVPAPKVSAVISAEVTPAVHYQAGHAASYAHAEAAHAGYAQYSANYVTEHAAGATPYSAAAASAPADGYGYGGAAEYYDYDGKDYAYDNQAYAAPPPPAYDHQAYEAAPPPAYDHQAYAAPPTPAYDHQAYAAPPPPAYDHQAYAAPPTPAPLPKKPCKASNKGAFVSRLALATAN